MMRRLHTVPPRPPPALPRGHWGLRLAVDARAAAVEKRWRLPLVLALAATIPAFYAELLSSAPPLAARLAYLVAALVVAAALAHTAHRSREQHRHALANPLDFALVGGLVLSAALPASAASLASLLLRLAVSLLVLVRMLWAMQRLVTRGSPVYLVLLAMLVLVLSGAGFWWLEPTTPTFAEGLWLAFTTAATVGYGDVVPTTPASRIFAGFVVLFGFGLLMMATAAIAASWVETEERRIEREILHDLRNQVETLRSELVALRAEMRSSAHLQAEVREVK